VAVLCFAFLGPALVGGVAGGGVAWAAASRWASSLREKAVRWERSLLDAVVRLEAAAAAADPHLEGELQRRLGEMTSMVRVHAEAVEEVLKQPEHPLHALAAGRARTALEVAQRIERELAEVVAGHRERFSVDLSRLGTRARATMLGAMQEVSASLGKGYFEGAHAIAPVIAENEDTPAQWGKVLGVAAGMVLVTLGFGVLWPQPRAGEQGRRRQRRLGVKALGVMGVLAGMAAIGLCARQWKRDATDPAGEVVLAVRQCAALEKSGAAISSKDAAVLEPLIRELARCQLSSANDEAARLITEHLRSALAARAGSGAS
jgi:hypothetical protein